MASPRTGPKLVAVAVIRRGDQVLLVRQQGPKDPEPHWSLPGGLVEAGELLVETLAREVKEETGLQVLDPGRVAWVAQIQLEDPEWGGISTVVAFDVADSRGEPACDDPDGVVQVAQYLPVTEAIELLRPLPLPASAPTLAFLGGTAEPGRFWTFAAGPGFADARMIAPGSAETTMSPAAT